MPFLRMGQGGNLDSMPYQPARNGERLADRIREPLTPFDTGRCVGLLQIEVSIEPEPLHASRLDLVRRLESGVSERGEKWLKQG